MKIKNLIIISGVIAILILNYLPNVQPSNLRIDDSENTDNWTEDIQITNYNSYDEKVAITVDNDNIHLIWSRYLTSPAGFEIFYTNSNNSGQTWTVPFQLSDNDYGVVNPDICNINNKIFVCWNERVAPLNAYEIFFRSSPDGGLTWNPEIMMSTDDGWNSQNAKIAINGSEIHIVWVDYRHKEESMPWNTELYYIRSLDGGITWDDGLGNIGLERRLTNALYESFGGYGLYVEGDAIHLAWGDARNGVTVGDIYYMRSLDKGATWDDGLGNVGQDRRLTNNLTSSHSSATVAANGSMIHVTWVDEVWPGPSYYIYYRNSTDNGVNWGQIRLLTGPSQMISSPDLSANGNDVNMVWGDSRDGDKFKPEIYYKNSTDGGISWNPDLRLTYNLTGASQWPRISLANGIKHIAWWDDRDGNSEIYYKRSPDFPDLSPPTHLNETPLPDSYKDAPGTNVSVHVTDPSGVNASTIQLWVNGSLVSHTLIPITDGYNVSWVSGGFGPGIVTCRIIAEDNCSNLLDYTWNFTVLALCEIQLQEGWNLISVPLEQVDTSVPSVLASITGKWDVVKYYNNLDKSDPWKTYRVGSSMNDLVGIDNTMGFWIYVTEPNVNLTVRGNIPTYTTIPLYAGWNLVGYPTQTTETVGNVLWGTGADRFEVFDPASPYIKDVGPTYIMKPGEGYWIHVPADTIWVINW